jgi:hypothetical protein
VEVCSYGKDTRGEAKTILADLFHRFQSVERDKGRLNANQTKLRRRCLILAGNIEFLNGAHQDAAKHYAGAFAESKNEDPFSCLSLAHAEEFFKAKGKKTSTKWQKGLKLLKASGALQRSERSTRATNLGWATLASRRLGISGDQQAYMTALKALESGFMNVAGKIPLVFSPVSKFQTPFDDFVAEIEKG